MGKGDPIAPTQGHKSFPAPQKIGDPRLPGKHTLECVIQQQVCQTRKDLFLGWHPKHLTLHRLILHRQKRELRNDTNQDCQHASQYQLSDNSGAQVPKLCQF